MTALFHVRDKSWKRPELTKKMQTNEYNKMELKKPRFACNVKFEQ